MKSYLHSLGKWPIWHNYSPTEWVLISVGALALFYIALNFFTSFGDQTPPPKIDSSVSLNDIGQFEETLAHAVNSNIYDMPSDSVKILTNGGEFLPDLLSEIQTAKSSISITDYIWDGGSFGNTLFEALIKKAQEGVEVKVLVDGTGGHKADTDLIKKLEQAGGKFARFRPVRWWNLNRIDRRTHVRDFVIDNKTAYVGGIAISDLWLGDATTSKSWHDFMFKSGGLLADQSAKIFNVMWSNTTGEILQTSSNTELGGKLAPKGSSFVPLFSVPSPDMSHNMEHFIWLSMGAADHSIHIENPYLVPSKSLLQMLENKAREGVDVKIIVPGKNTDAKYTRWATQSFYSELLKAGVRIFEYQPSRIHAKIMVFDNKWSIVGSANLDNRSSQINLEYVVGIADPKFATNLEDKFQEDLTKTKEITKENWKGTSTFKLPFELVSKIFIKQY